MLLTLYAALAECLLYRLQRLLLSAVVITWLAEHLTNNWTVTEASILVQLV